MVRTRFAALIALLCISTAQAFDEHQNAMPDQRVQSSSTVPPPDAAPAVRDGITPFQRQVCLPLGGGENVEVFVAPPGKVVVFEYVSARAKVPFGQDVSFGIETSVGAEHARHWLVSVWPDYGRVTDNDSDVVTLRQWMRAYADGGTKVKVIATRNGRWGVGTACIAIAGFIVP